jgi:hypothetical protein
VTDIIPIPGKATVLKVGSIRVRVRRDGSRHLTLRGWVLDCRGTIAAHDRTADGFPTYCGYTQDELLEIHRRRGEWV